MASSTRTASRRCSARPHTTGRATILTLTLTLAIALAQVLGPPKYDGPRDNAYRLTKPGIAAGLAYTPVGGDLLYVEVERMRGRGELVLTGQLGDVMQESAKAARSWVRAHANELGLTDDDGGLVLNATDLHIHFPAGAMPKDGPSAGVTITTAIVSLLTGRLVRPDLAMTGEVTLRGLVLPVGGIKEKVIAAHRGGMRTVIMPAKNEKDLRELPPTVLKEMNFTFVKEVGEVLAAALLPPSDSTKSGADRGEGEGDAGGKGDAGGEGDDAVDDEQRLPSSPIDPPVPMPMPSAMRSAMMRSVAAPLARRAIGKPDSQSLHARATSRSPIVLEGV